MTIRYVRPEEKVAREFRKHRAGIRDVQRPTGTEIHRTKDVAEQAAGDSEFAKGLVEELGLRTDELEDDVEQAQLTADQKNRTFRSSSPPSGEASEGDRWEQYDKSSTPWKLLGSWSYEDDSWEPIELDPTYLPLVDIGSGTFGQLSGDRFAVNALDFMTAQGMSLMASEITGGTVEQVSTNTLGLDFTAALPKDANLWASEGTFQSIDELPGTPPAAVRSTAHFLPVPSVFESELVGVTTVRSPSTFPAIAPVTVSVWVFAWRVAKTVSVRWPDGTTQSRSLSANTWTLLTRNCASNEETLRIVQPVNAWPLPSRTVSVADVRFESTATIVSRSLLSTDQSSPQLSFWTGVQGSSQSKIGEVSPDGLALAGIEIRDGGVILPGRGSVSSDGPIVIAGDSVNIAANKEIALSGRTTNSGNTFDTLALLNAWSAPDGTRAWVSSENREYVRKNGSWRMPGAPDWVLRGANSPNMSTSATRFVWEPVPGGDPDGLYSETQFGVTIPDTGMYEVSVQVRATGVASTNLWLSIDNGSTVDNSPLSGTGFGQSGAGTYIMMHGVVHLTQGDVVSVVRQSSGSVGGAWSPHRKFSGRRVA